MTKRVVAGFLWLYAGWFVGAFAAFAFGWSPALGPIVGVAAAAVVTVDPRRLIWHRAPVATTTGEAVPA